MLKSPKRVLLLGLGALVAVAVITPVVALAHSSDDPYAGALDRLADRGVITEEQAEAVLGETAPILEQLRRHRGSGGPGKLRSVRPDGGPRMIVKAAADALGIDVQALMEMVSNGVTLSEAIEAQGSSIEEVLASVTARMRTKLDEAVAAGGITEERAAEAIERVEASLRRALESADLGTHLATARDRVSRAAGGLPGIQGIIGGAAEALGVDPQELIEALRGGSTLQQAIEAQGSTVEEVIDHLVTKLQEKLDAAVAEGRITAEHAADRVASFEQQARQAMEGTPRLSPGANRARVPFAFRGAGGGFGREGVSQHAKGFGRPAGPAGSEGALGPPNVEQFQERLSELRERFGGLFEEGRLDSGSIGKRFSEARGRFGGGVVLRHRSAQ